MQHLLLAISIITLTLIAGNGREKPAPKNTKVSMKMEKPAIDKPSVIFSRFEMFVY